MMKKYVIILFLFSCTSLFPITSYYSMRSQSLNAALEMVGAGWNSHINLCEMNEWYGNFAIACQYTRSFKSEEICKCLFGQFTCCNNSCCLPQEQQNSMYCQGHKPYCSCCNMPCCDACCDKSSCFVTVSGSHVANRGPKDLLADYCGLPTDYQSIVCFRPEISNLLVECDFYLGLDEWLSGLYLVFRAPITHTRWDLNMCECVLDDGSNDHVPGYFNGSLNGTDPNFYGIERQHLVPSFTAFITGCSFIDVNDIRFLPLYYAKMSCNERKKTALADLRMELGWNFLCNNRYNMGINFQTACPTGNRPEGFYLFEPIVGNGKHWEVGVGINARWNFYKSIDECNCASMLFDANITHMLKTKQVRTFDLCGKPLSRYMLAAKFTSPVNNLKAGVDGGTLEIPNKQFKGIYEPVANLATFSVDVGVTAQAEITGMLQYSHSCFSVDIGYTLWVRTCEHIDFRCDCPCPFDTNTWGLKGDSFMYGFKQNLDGSLSTTAVPLSATQSHASICKGQNRPPDGFDNLAWPQNPGIDNRQSAWDESDRALLVFDPVHTTTKQVYTSLDPILIDYCDIDLNRAGTKGMSHKFFAHIDYRWGCLEHWVPYIGVGGEVEFGRNDTCCSDLCNPYSCNNCSDSCNTCCIPPGPCCDTCRCCTYCSLSQWGVWLKGGVAFH